jgi:hypothetical protein
LSGKIFEGLDWLTTVWLNNNVCVNKHFNDTETIAAIRKKIPKACAFCEHDDLSIQITCEMFEQMQEKLLDKILKTEVEIPTNEMLNQRIIKLELEVKSCNTEINVWKSQVDSWKDANSLCHSRNDLIKDTFDAMTMAKETFEKLDSERNEKFRELMEAKVLETQKLQTELQTLQKEMGEKEIKIGNIEEKLKT